MLYFRRILGLGALTAVISLLAFVSLASAHGTTGAALEEQVAANVGMLQTTPTTTATVTTTDQTTDTTGSTATTAPTDANNTGGAAQATITATATTDAAGGAAQATATPAGGVQQQGTQQQGTQQQSPGNLPATGGEIGLPWMTLALIVIGGLVLFSGLGLAMSRRS